MFASESDLELSQAENPPVEVTLLAGEGWQRLTIPVWSSLPASPLPFWHRVIFSFLKQL